jgi:putative hemolysin
MRAVAVMLLALVLALPASAAPLTRPLPQTKAMPLATDIGPVKLTDSECTNLGGTVRSTMTKECSSGKVCRRADAEGVVRSVCISAAQ